MRWIVCWLVVLGSGVGYTQDFSFDRTLDQLAGEMVRAYPELQGLKRSSEIRAELVKEFRDIGVEDVPRSWMRDKRRRKIDYEAHGWVELVNKFEKADIATAQAKYLLKIAREQKLKFDEHHVVEQLMYFYHKKYVLEREEESRERLAEVGKQFTYFVRANEKDPQSLLEFVKHAEQRMGIDPETGDEAPWVFVGAGPSEIRGGNGYRVVAYAPFTSGSRGRYRWVVYRGGRVTEWKSDTILSAHKRMDQKNVKLAEKQKQELAKAQQSSEKKVVQAQVIMASVLAQSLEPVEQPEPKKKALRITIKELW